MRYYLKKGVSKIQLAEQFYPPHRAPEWATNLGTGQGWAQVQSPVRDMCWWGWDK